MMTDDTLGAEISEFAGLRSKCFALSIERSDMNIDFNKGAVQHAWINHKHNQIHWWNA
jgi:hypothetical protein